MSAGAGDVPVLQAASLPWGRISFQFFLFASHFAIFGALSFRFLVLRRARGLFAGADTAPLMAVVAAVERGAARVGMGGSLLLLADLVSNAARNAAAQQVTILSALLPAKPAFLTQLLCALLLILAFAAALRGSRRA